MDKLTCDIDRITIDSAALKRYRGRRSMREVGDVVGRKKQHIWNYEHGKANPPAEILARLCALYDCKISDITKKTLPDL